MTFVVFGGAGPLGRVVCTQLVEAGEHVRCVDIVEPDAYRGQLPASDRLQLLRGDVTDEASVKAALERAQGAGTVVFTAAATTMSTDAVDHRGVASVAAAAKAAGAQRMLLVSSCMVTQQHRWNPVRVMLNRLVKRGMLDNKFRGEEALRGAGLPYVILRAARLTDKPAGEHRLQVGQGDKLAGEVSRGDVAAVLLAAAGSARCANCTFELVTRKPLEPAPAGQLGALFDELQPDKEA